MTGRQYQQRDVEALRMARPWCKAVLRPTDGANIPSAVLHAAIIATSGTRGPVAIEIPVDFLSGWHPGQLCGFDAAAAQLTAQQSPAAAAPRDRRLASILDSCAGLDPAPRVVSSLWAALAIARAAGRSAEMPTVVALSSPHELAAAAHELKLAMAEGELPLLLLLDHQPGGTALAQALGLQCVAAGSEELEAQLAAAAQIKPSAPTVLSLPPADARPAARCPDRLLQLLRRCEVDKAIGCGVALEPDESHQIQIIPDARAAGIAAAAHWRHTGKLAAVLLDTAVICPAAVGTAMAEASLSQSAVLLVLLANPKHQLQQSWWPACKAVLRSSPQEAPSSLLVRGAAECLSGPAGVVVVVLPGDLSADSFECSQTVQAPANPPANDEKVVTAVAEMLCSATQPLLVVGAGANGCQPQLVQLAQSCGAVVASTFSGKGAFPEQPGSGWLWTGLGAGMPRSIQEVMHKCDAALVLGARLSEAATSQYHLQLPTRCFHVDLDPQVPSTNWNAHPIVSDVESFLASLTKHLSTRCGNQHTFSSDHLISAHSAAQEEMESVLDPNLLGLMRCLNELLPKNAVYTTDAGGAMHLAAEALRLSTPRCFLTPADSCTSEFAMSAAIGIASSSAAPLVVAITTSLRSVLDTSKFRATCSAPVLIILLRPTTEKVDALEETLGLGNVKLVPASSGIHAGLNAALAMVTPGQFVLLDCAMQPAALHGQASMYGRGLEDQTVVAGPQNTKPLPLTPSRRYFIEDIDAWSILQGAVTRWPDSLAVVDGDTRLTYRDVHNHVMRIAAQLAQILPTEGPRHLASLLNNTYHCLEAHYIAAATRSVHVNLNVRLTPKELAFIISDSATGCIIADHAHRKLLTEALALMESTSPRPEVIWVGSPDDFKDGRSYELMLNTAEVDSYHVPPLSSPSEGFQMYYTSGTTGFPKGVVLSYDNVIRHAAGAMIEFQFEHSDVWAHLAPMFHLVDAFAVYCITWCGARHVFLREWNAAAAIELIARERVTISNVAPTMMSMILSNPKLAQHDVSSLRMISNGGAPLAPKVIQQALDTLGCTYFMSYGMTECCGKISISCYNSSGCRGSATDSIKSQEDLLRFVCSTGTPFIGMCIRVVDDDGFDVAIGETGECLIRGDSLMAGYWNRPDANEKSFLNGWFKTGDAAKITPEGWVYIVDRKKDMILFGGENVYAAEVERVVGSHEAVQLCAVIGVPDPNGLMGEYVKAFVVLHNGASLNRRQLVSYCRNHLAVYKLPALVDFVDSLPMTGSGKVKKSELKKQHLLQAEAPVVELPSRPALEHTNHSDPQTVSAAIPDWISHSLHSIQWQRLAMPNKQKVHQSGVLLVVSTVGDLYAPAVSIKLESAGIHIKLHHIDGNASSEKRKSALEKALDAQVAGVVFLAGLGCTEFTEASAYEPMQALMQLMQSFRHDIPLWLFTRGAQTLQDESGVPSQMALWGACRVIAVEHPAVKAFRIDLCPQADVDTCAGHAADAIAFPSTDEDEVAIRMGQRFSPRLRPLDCKLGTIQQCSSGSSYVITGGVGGLGLQLSRYLLERCSAKHLVLLSRSGNASSEKVTGLMTLAHKHNAKVIVQKCDVAVEQDVQRVLASVKDSCKGIFHLAGVLDDGYLKDLSWERFDKVMQSKVKGTINLHQISERLELKLDAFVLFSSVYSLLGYAQLSHYAAANSFLEAVAQMRRCNGQPALSVNWGLWEDDGMAHRLGSSFERYWRSQGMGYIPAEEGMSVLMQLLSQPQNVGCNVGVFPVEDWTKYNKSKHAPKCGLVADYIKACATPPETANKISLAQSAPLPGITSLVAQVFEEVTGNENIQPDESLADAGIDSFNAIEFTNMLCEATGEARLPASLVFDYPTMQQIVGYLESRGVTIAQVDSSKAESPVIQESLTSLILSVSLEVTGNENIQPDESLADAGIDSFNAIEFTNMLCEATGEARLPASLVFDYPTVQEIAGYLEGRGIKATGSASASESNVVAASQLSALTAATANPMIDSTSPSSDQPIAIIGMSCQLPNNIGMAAQFWGLLDNSICTAKDVPASRWDKTLYYSENKMARGKCYTNAGCWVEDADLFAAKFFKVAKAEALAMDPKQRMLLEMSYVALNCAGFTRKSLMGDDVGVFVGVCSNDWCLVTQHQRITGVSATGNSGCSAAIHSNRVSYVLGLKGPSMTVDTACSASLVGLDASIKYLKDDSCSTSLVAGVNLCLSPYMFVALSKANMLSPTGRNATFDNSADGYVRGEGCCAAALQIYSAAKVTCSAVITFATGSAVNQDGASQTLTAPNGPAQQAVIRRAHKMANVQPNEVSSIEAHGTGTSLGDVIEFTALREVFANGRKMPSPLVLGSAKPNVGHLEGAAGITGLAKAVLSIVHRRALPVPHLRTINESFDLQGFPVGLPCGASFPLCADGPLVAGVSSFGFGGTNSHVMLEEAVNSDPGLVCDKLISTVEWEYGRMSYAWAPPDAFDRDETNQNQQLQSKQKTAIAIRSELPWLFETNWQRLDLQLCQAPRNSQRWLVITSPKVSLNLSIKMCRGDFVFAKCMPEPISDEMPPMEALLAKRDWDGILFLTALDSSKDQVDILDAALRMTQALTSIHKSPPPIVFLTSGTQPVEGPQAVSRPQHAGLWGFARAVALEHPGIALKCVDIDRQGKAEAEMVLHEAASNRGGVGHESEVCIYDQTRFVHRVIPSPLMKQDIPAQKLEGTYLVTGGTGGLGLVTACWLVQQGVKHLILMSRSGKVPAGSEDHWKHLQSLDVKIARPCGDVGNSDEVRMAMSTAASQSWPAVTGIIHAAGTLDDAILRNQTKSRIKKVWDPKVVGAFNLLKAMPKNSIQHFVVFSSIASTFGGAGQTNYSAANAAIDAAVHYARANGINAHSIQWGAVSQVGMGARTQADSKLQRIGLSAVNCDMVENALSKVLFAKACAKLAVVPVDWDLYLKKRPKSTEMIAAGARPTFPMEKPSAPAAHRLDVKVGVSQVLLGIAEELLGEAVQPSDNLMEAGLDSLLSAEFCQAMNEKLGGVQVEIATLLELGCISALVAELENEPQVKAALGKQHLPERIETLPMTVVSHKHTVDAAAPSASGYTAWRDAQQSESPQMLVEVLLGIAEELLGEAVQPSDNLMEAGLDSLLSAEFCQAMNEKLGGVQVEIATLLELGCISALVAELENEPQVKAALIPRLSEFALKAHNVSMTQVSPIQTLAHADSVQSGLGSIGLNSNSDYTPSAWSKNPSMSRQKVTTSESNSDQDDTQSTSTPPLDGHKPATRKQLQTFKPTSLSSSCPMPSPLVFLWQTLFVPLYVLLMIVGLPLFPAVWFYHAPFARDDWTEQQFLYLQPLMMIVFILASTLMTIVSKWLWIGIYPQGCFVRGSWFYQRWHLMNSVVGAWESMAGYMFQGNVSINIIYKLLGADISIGSKLTSFVRNFDLVHVDRNSVVRANLITGIHYADPVRLYLAPVRVHEGCFLDYNSTMEPGSIVHASCKLNSLTCVTTLTQLEPNSEYEGNPARLSGTSPATQQNQLNLSSLVVLLNAFAVPYLGSLLMFKLWYVFSKDLGSSTMETTIAVALAIILSCLAALVASVLIKWVLFGSARPRSRLRENVWYKLVEDLVWRFKRIADLILTYLYGHSPLYNAMLWFYGGSAKLSTHIVALAFNPLEADLIRFGENCEVSAIGIRCSVERFENGVIVHDYDSVVVGDGSELGLLSVLEAGTSVGTGSSVGASTRVPPGVAVPDHWVYFGNPAFKIKKRPSERAEIEYLGLSLFDWVVRCCFQLIFRLLILLVLLAASVVAAIEVTKLTGHGLGDDFFNLVHWHRDDHTDHWLVVAARFTINYLIFVTVFAFTLGISVILMKWFTMWRFREGSLRRYDLLVQTYQTYVMLTGSFLPIIFNSFANGTVWARIIYKLLGAKVSVFGGSHIMLCGYDHDLITIGDGAVVNEACGIMAHIYEHGCLFHRPVTVGINACVHPLAMVMAGDTISDGATIGCLSKTFGPIPVPPGTMVLGSPSKQVRCIDITAEDEAAYDEELKEPASGDNSWCFDIRNCCRGPCVKSHLECQYEALQSVVIEQEDD